MSEPIPKAPLSEVADITMGQSPDSAYVNEEEHGWPFLQGCAEFGARHPMAKVHCMPPLRTARAGSTLISVRAPVGAMNRADQDYCIGRGLAAVFAKPGYTDNIFLLHAIEENLSFLHRRSQGSTFLAIGTADLSMMPVAAPPLAQQQRIAEILSTMDEAIEQTEALIAKTQQIKAGLMHDLFTRGVTKDGKLRPPREEAPQLYKESPLGWIPKEWDCPPIENLLASITYPMRSGPFGSALLKEELVEDGIPLLGIDNVFAERFVAEFRRFVTPHKFMELSRYTVFPGDVIITIMGTVGRCCVVPEDTDRALSSKHLWTMTFDQNKVAPPLICWQLNYAPWVKSWFAKHSQGAVMDAIQSSTLRSLTLPLPPLAEQEIIQERYLSLQVRESVETERCRKFNEIKAGLMHDLLTGRVRVKTESALSAESAHV